MDFLQFYKVTNNQSDKGTVHCYIEHWYNNEFTPIRYNKLNILEIGINKGDSIILWRDWFINSNIFFILLKFLDSYSVIQKFLNNIIHIYSLFIYL